MENKYCWTLGWSGDIELGVGDGFYLPRKSAILLHPEYFDEKGEPVLGKLPMDRERKDNDG